MFDVALKKKWISIIVTTLCILNIFLVIWLGSCLNRSYYGWLGEQESNALNYISGFTRPSWVESINQDQTSPWWDGRRVVDTLLVILISFWLVSLGISFFSESSRKRLLICGLIAPVFFGIAASIARWRTEEIGQSITHDPLLMQLENKLEVNESVTFMATRYTGKRSGLAVTRLTDTRSALEIINEYIWETRPPLKFASILLYVAVLLRLVLIWRADLLKRRNQLSSN